MKIHGYADKNKIDCDPNFSSECNIHFNSYNCRLIIGPECDLTGLMISFNRPNQVVNFIGKNRIDGSIYLNGNNIVLTFGEKTKNHSVIWMNVGGYDTHITLGRECLLSNVRFRNFDSHKIFNIESGEHLNVPGDIIVGDKVWIAEDVLLLKGTNIGSGSIIGARSMVNGTLPANCLAVGTPARVIQTGVRWEE